MAHYTPPAREAAVYGDGGVKMPLKSSMGGQQGPCQPARSAPSFASPWKSLAPILKLRLKGARRVEREAKGS